MLRLAFQDVHGNGVSTCNQKEGRPTADRDRQLSCRSLNLFKPVLAGGFFRRMEPVGSLN
jgi:hypothetical protein